MTPKKTIRRCKIAVKCSGKNCPRRGIKNSDFNRVHPREKYPRVSDLVYNFLENVASANDERRQRNNARTNFQRAHVRKYNRQNRRPDNPKSTDGILLQSQYQIPTKSDLEPDFHSWPSMERKIIGGNRDAVEPSGKKSSSQFVKDYVKAVNESKRRAERYICKALSFGVDVGFLVPTVDSDGHVLRVSSALDVKMLKQNLDWRNGTVADDRENRKICSCERGRRQKSKIDESAYSKGLKSKSEKTKNKKTKLNPKETKSTSDPGPAIKRRKKSKEGKGSNKSRDESEADDSDEFVSEKSSSEFIDEEENVPEPKKSVSSSKPSSKKRRVTDSDENFKDADVPDEIVENDNNENHDRDGSDCGNDHENH